MASSDCDGANLVATGGAPEAEARQDAHVRPGPIQPDHAAQDQHAEEPDAVAAQPRASQAEGPQV